VDLQVFIYVMHKSCPNFKFHIAVSELSELNRIHHDYATRDNRDCSKQICWVRLFM